MATFLSPDPVPKETDNAENDGRLVAIIDSSAIVISTHQDQSQLEPARQAGNKRKAGNGG